MPKGPDIALSRLREIGWSKWDPIGVGGPEHGWPADEYDAYLLQVAGRLWHGGSVEEAADYLVRIVTDHMGLGAAPDVQARAFGVATEICRYIETLRT